jgi:choline dehydrogenase-like flavoprotein
MKYDVVIVGGGVAGSILAKQLTWAGKRVLVLEAGTNLAETWEGYDSYLQNFYTQWLKTDQAPYGLNPNARFPQGIPDNHGKPAPMDDYVVSAGAMGFPASYVRQLGGTSLHWTGTMLRMMPSDFKLATLYGQGRDWPIGYTELSPYYNRAEWEIGVAGSAAEQTFSGVEFDPGYDYPMQPIPASYMDQRMAGRLDGMSVEESGEEFVLKLVRLPQARNSTPNPGYQPAGALGRRAVSSRWQTGVRLRRLPGPDLAGPAPPSRPGRPHLVLRPPPRRRSLSDRLSPPVAMCPPRVVTCSPPCSL